MREIKFRAWNGVTKTMIFLDPLQWGLSAVTGSEPEWCVMQFTGLYDKNRKEIYEGDIVRVTGHYDGDHWHRDYKAPVICDETGEWWCDEPEHGVFMGDSLWEAVTNFSCEVIGNIYENPELCSQGSSSETVLDNG